MKLIKKKSPPSSLIAYIRKSHVSYDDMDSKVKEELLISLVDEQFGICAYCQQKLRTIISIEHHCERSICNGENGTEDKRLDYKNLFAVCEGIGGQFQETHCDTRKAEKSQNPKKNGLPMIFIPTNPSHISTIKYSSTGLVSSSNQLYNNELNNLLHLNADHLKDMRKQEWKRIHRKSKSGRLINKNKMRQLLQQELTLKNGKFSKLFPGLLEYMQNKFCQKKKQKT